MRSKGGESGEVGRRGGDRVRVEEEKEKVEGGKEKGHKEEDDGGRGRRGIRREGGKKKEEGGGRMSRELPIGFFLLAIIAGSSFFKHL